MNITNISTYVFVLLVSAATTAAYSQQREIKESLVFSDPTVAKSDNWVKGFSIDTIAILKRVLHTTHKAARTLTRPPVTRLVLAVFWVTVTLR